MVLAELSCHVAERLEQFGKRRVLVRKPLLGSRQTHFQQTGAHRTLASDKRGTARSARLLAIVVGEDRPLVGDAVDVGRAVAHLATIVGADVPVADVIGHDDEDVGRGPRGLLGERRRSGHERESDGGECGRGEMFRYMYEAIHDAASLYKKITTRGRAVLWQWATARARDNCAAAVSRLRGSRRPF